MRSIIVSIILLMASLPGYADYQAGVDAYNDGDYLTAFKEMKSLAEQGNADAQNNLGWLYNYGEGVPQNFTEAVKWYRKGAEQGNAAAQTNLGVMYAYGQGVPQNFTEAAKWSRLAAEQGQETGQKNLGTAYKNGEGVPQDYAECYAWSNIVAASGDGEAKNNRDICASKLSPEALSKAQEKAREYWEKYGTNDVN